MASQSITTDRTVLSFGKTPFTVRDLRDRASNVSFLRGAEQSLIVRTPTRVSDPFFLTVVEEFSCGASGARMVLTDESGSYRAELVVTPDPRGLKFALRATGPVPLWMVEWKLTGLQLREVIIPALGGQSLGRGMPPETTLTYKYPFWWNAQFVIGVGGRGGVWLRTCDVEPRFKLVRVRRHADSFSLGLGFEADGPLRSCELRAEWYLDTFVGSWKVPTRIHREWMQEAFHLRELDRNPFMPAWGRDIDFVLELWGMAKDRPTALHTFDQMKKRLKAFAHLHDPRRTLVYLPGFAEHGIDSHAPSYEPSPGCGGAAKFKELVDLAHRLGYRVMIHTNVLCLTFDHPEFERFHKHQVVDVFGRTQGWALDIDGDWLAEPYFAYVNPGVREWGDLMERVIGGLVQRFGVDGVFLDQTLLAFNTAEGPNFQTGMREHLLRLQNAFPGVLFAGEGYHELVAQALPMAQIHGIDSIAEVHGMEGRARWRKAHPVSTTLFGSYTRFTAHLLTRHPSHPMFPHQERAYGELGVIPALCLYNADQPLDTPATRAMARRAAKLSGRRR